MQRHGDHRLLFADDRILFGSSRDLLKLAAISLIMPVELHATAYLIIRTPTHVVIAADSMVVDAHGNPQSRITTCHRCEPMGQSWIHLTEHPPLAVHPAELTKVGE